MSTRKQLVSAFLVTGGVIGMVACSEKLPFSVETSSSPASFSNFRIAKNNHWGVTIDELRFDVKIEAVDRACRSMVIYYNVISKTGVYIKKGLWHQRIPNPTVREAHTGSIGDKTVEWPQVGKVQIWAQCSPA